MVHRLFQPANGGEVAHSASTAALATKPSLAAWVTKTGDNVLPAVDRVRLPHVHAVSLAPKSPLTCTHCWSKPSRNGLGRKGRPTW
jgi:hypothetical protein